MSDRDDVLQAAADLVTAFVNNDRSLSGVVGQLAAGGI